MAMQGLKLYYETEESAEGGNAFREKRKPEFGSTAVRLAAPPTPTGNDGTRHARQRFADCHPLNESRPKPWSGIRKR